MRQVKQIMGLPISIDIPGRADKQLFSAAFDRLRQIDSDYSPYKIGSYVSRVRNGILKLDALPVEQQQVLHDCEAWKTRTNGYFDAFYDKGIYEPSGYVKGWAIQQIADLLQKEHVDTFCINAGGDILLRSAGEHIWRIALQHPLERNAIMGTVAAANQAIATSGTYARGNHIYNPLTNHAMNSILSVTVIGPDIISSDVYATALCAMGYEDAKLFVSKLPKYRVIIVSQNLDAFDSALPA